MNPEFFKNLPSEIIIDILSRLPFRTIIRCKFVCKSWLDLVETHEFAKSHLSKSVPGLAIADFNIQAVSYKIFEFEDGLDLEHHGLHYNPVMKFDLPSGELLGSINGLLFLLTLGDDSSTLRICNPVTWDCIKLHCPGVFTVDAFGFGASKITGQYKAVRIFQVKRKLWEVAKFGCQVYTLGTGSWRNILPGASLLYDSSIGAFLNGNLHWLVFDLNDCPWISCFNLETELFSTFSPPPLPGHSKFRGDLFALEDCLCVCDTSDDDIVIWLMKEYGVEKSWTKEFVIPKCPDGIFSVVRPVKVFKDGDILMAWGNSFLFYYSKKNETTQKIDIFERHSPGSRTYAILHTPSFLSLKSFEMENVSSF